VKLRSNSSKVRSRPSWLGLSTSAPLLKAAAALACDVVDVISAVCTVRRDAGVNPTFRRLAATCGSPEAEAALLLASVNDGRHGGRGADSALLTAWPLEVPCAETALWALRGLTDGRQGIRSGLLERSGLGVALEGRWAEAAAPEPSAKRAVMFVIAAACSRAVNGGRWAEAAAPELLTLLLAVVPGSRWAEAAAPEISTLLFAFVLGVAVSKGGGLATLGGRDVGGNIFGGRTAGHSTGMGDAVAGSVARTAGTGGAAAAAA
jgi:hypothetical protein